MSDDSKQPPPLEFEHPAEQLRQVRAGRAPSEEEPVGVPPRPPWTWSLLSPDEATAVTQLIHQWVVSYNHTHACWPNEMIPACWPAHPGLATELAVLVWYWHDAHLTASDPGQAAEFYTRHLPAFRERLPRMLGAGHECQKDGEHVPNWRYQADPLLAAYPAQPTNDAGGLGVLDYGFTRTAKDAS